MLRNLSTLLISSAIYLHCPVLLADSAENDKAKKAEESILALGTKVAPIEESSILAFQKQMLDTTPILLALHSENGGRFLLFRPLDGEEGVLEAALVPRLYGLAKSLIKSSLGLYGILSPMLKDSTLTSERSVVLKDYLGIMQAARGQLGNLTLTTFQHEAFQSLLDLNIDFINRSLKGDDLSLDSIKNYAAKVKEPITKLIDIASTVQTEHWVKVLRDWKAMLGKDFGQLHAVVSTPQANRQNNILFTILAQFMNEKAINSKLLLAENASIAAEDVMPDSLIYFLAKTLYDRKMGEAYFNDGMMMNTDWFASGARMGLHKALRKYSLPPARMPGLAPFNSNEWPWRTNADYGCGARLFEEAGKPCSSYTPVVGPGGCMF